MAVRMLFWSDVFCPHIGGLAVWAGRYTRAMAEQGHDIRVVTPQLAPEHPLQDDFHGIPVQRVPLWNAFRDGQAESFRQAREMVEALIRDFRPEMVQLSPALGAPSLLLFILSSAARLPNLLTLHDDWPARHTLSGSPIDKVARSASWVTAFSRASLNEVRLRWPELTGRSSVILHGMNPPERALPAPPDPGAILFAGRTCKVKGVDVLLDAFARVLPVFPQARLRLAGDDPERRGFEEQADRLGINRSVDFLGWVEPAGIAALLDDAALVVMPSRAEPFGLVAIEAAWHGRPVVASSVGGLAEIVVDARTGLLCPAGDTEALAAAIIRMLSDPTQMEEMGKAARTQAQDRFAWAAHVASFDALVHLIGHAGSPASG